MIPVIGQIPDIINAIQFFISHIGQGSLLDIIIAYFKEQWDSIVGLFTTDLKQPPYERGQLLGGVLIGILIAIVGLVTAALTAGISVEFSAAGILRLLKFGAQEAVTAGKSALRNGVKAVKQLGHGIRHGLPETVHGVGSLIKGKPHPMLGKAIEHIKAAPGRFARGKVGEVVEFYEGIVETKARVSTYFKNKEQEISHTSLYSIVDIDFAVDSPDVEKNLVSFVKYGDAKFSTHGTFFGIIPNPYSGPICQDSLGPTFKKFSAPQNGSFYRI